MRSRAVCAEPAHGGRRGAGWWGLARHFHYLPEIIAALLWTVPALFTHVLPYFYVTFLTLLLTVWPSKESLQSPLQLHGTSGWGHLKLLVAVATMPRTTTQSCPCGHASPRSALCCSAA